jgi:hypothetical protein
MPAVALPSVTASSPARSTSSRRPTIRCRSAGRRRSAEPRAARRCGPVRPLCRRAGPMGHCRRAVCGGGVTGRFPRSHLHRPNSHENRDGAVSSRNEPETIIRTDSVSWWKKPARVKIDPGAGQPAQSAVLEGGTGKGGGSRRARTPASTTNDGLFGRPRDLFDRRPGRAHEARFGG